MSALATPFAANSATALPGGQRGVTGGDRARRRNSGAALEVPRPQLERTDLRRLQMMASVGMHGGGRRLGGEQVGSEGGEGRGRLAQRPAVLGPRWRRSLRTSVATAGCPHARRAPGPGPPPSSPDPPGRRRGAPPSRRRTDRAGPTRRPQTAPGRRPPTDRPPPRAPTPQPADPRLEEPVETVRVAVARLLPPGTSGGCLPAPAAPRPPPPGPRRVGRSGTGPALPTAGRPGAGDRRPRRGHRRLGGPSPTAHANRR